MSIQPELSSLTAEDGTIMGRAWETHKSIP